MDTRSKIVTAAAAEKQMGEWLDAGTAVDVAVGTFDPLLAAHVEDLQTAGRPGARLVVMIADGSEPVIPRKDRLELVAALSVVDLVVGEAVANPPAQARVFDLRRTHEQRAQSFAEYVRQRNTA